MTNSSEQPSGDPELTVVVATSGATASVERSLASIIAACRDLRTEVFVVSAGDFPAGLRARFPGVAILEQPRGTLVPYLWAVGMQRARGRAVAVTIADCVVQPDWAKRLLAGLDEGVAGAGGRFVLEPRASATVRAVFLLRYSAFLATSSMAGTSVRRVPDIAADNAVYLRAHVQRHASLLSDGFWEVEFHHVIRREGLGFAVVPDATAALVAAASLSTLMMHRFAHGRHFGTWRTHELRHSRARIVLAAPAVPLAFFLRVRRRLIAAGDRPSRYLVALPAFVLLASAWALGEAVGAFARRARGFHTEPAAA